MANFTPDLYKRLGTTVSIDLGSLGDLGAIRDGVNALVTQASALPDQLDALQDAVGAQIGTAQTGITAQINAQLSTAADRLAQQFHDDAYALGQQMDGLASTTSSTLLELVHERRLLRERHERIVDLLEGFASGDPRTPPPALNERSGSVVRALHTCQSLVLSRASAQALAEARDKAIELLQGNENWIGRLKMATERRVNAWEERSEHYWTLQRLINDVAAASGQQPSPTALEPATTELHSTETA